MMNRKFYLTIVFNCILITNMFSQSNISSKKEVIVNTTFEVNNDTLELIKDNSSAVSTKKEVIVINEIDVDNPLKLPENESNKNAISSKRKPD